MNTCPQKTLLVYVPVLLAMMAISCAWSQEQSDPYGNSDYSGISLSSSSMDDIDAADVTADDDREPHAAGFDTSMRHNKRRRNHNMQINYNRDSNGMDMDNDLALWINEEQVKLLSGMFWMRDLFVCLRMITPGVGLRTGFWIKVYAITGGSVSSYVRDQNINLLIPTIPSEVDSVNFSWRSGTRKYYYHFDRLQSLDEAILKPPTVSIKVQGKVPQLARREYTNANLLF